MLHPLTKWLLAGARERVSRPRTRRSHFFGCVEQLEARTVLSASVGVAPVAPEVGEIVSAVSVVVDGIQLTAQPPQFEDATSAGFVDHAPRVSPRADGYPTSDMWRAAGLHHAHGGLPQNVEQTGLNMAPNFATLGKPPGPFPGGWQNSLASVFVVRVYSLITTDIETPSNRLPELESPPPVRSQAAPAPTEAPSPVVITGATVPQFSPARVNNPTRSPAAIVAAASIPSPYFPNYATTNATSSTSAVSLVAHDAVFQEYSSQQLLLVANTNGSNEVDADSDADDGWKITDNEENEVARAR